ncbi:MAG: hypothetical protein V1926_01725 [Candidatus Peregrinibacteria bacterium]
MSKRPPIQITMQWLTLSLAVLCVSMVGYAVTEYRSDVTARLATNAEKGVVPWKTISEQEIKVGATVPSDTNVLIHIPSGTGSIQREVLLGFRGKRTRYWGYCFPDDTKNLATAMRRSPPGLLFLSEKEREYRTEQERKKLRSATLTIPISQLKESRLNETDLKNGRIRHQKEIFQAGETCYIMTSEPLPIGIDDDGDDLNNKLERDYKTDPKRKDTDGDGLNDNVEILSSTPTNPLVRDSDGDGLIDGIEDADHDGVLDGNETNPFSQDSDHDGLCDGLCRAGRNGMELRGEDVNLNGSVDSGETDPRKIDSDGDGTIDEQEYFNCVLKTGAPCKYSSFKVK